MTFLLISIHLSTSTVSLKASIAERSKRLSVQSKLGLFPSPKYLEPYLLVRLLQVQFTRNTLSSARKTIKEERNQKMKHYFQQFAASTLRSAEYQQSILQSVSAMDVFGGFIKGSPDGACGRMVSLGSLRGALRLQIIELLATTAMRAQI